MKTDAMPWAPPRTRELQLLPAGERWDAVRVPHRVGLDVVYLLGDRTGGVILDAPRYLYWLVLPGSADGWDVPPGRDVTVLGQACHVVVPGSHAVGNPFWYVLPDQVLTDADELWSAMQIALGRRL